MSILATDWTRYPEEIAQSQYKPERMDTPIDAAVWLQHFRAHNIHLLDELDVSIYIVMILIYIYKFIILVEIFQAICLESKGNH